MSNFFNSEFIQQELREINDLQDFVYGSVFSFGRMNREDKLEHIDKMSLLLEKQRIMYTRLSLSDDPEAIEMKENLKKSVLLMGFPEDTDINLLFNNMNKTIESLKTYLD
jgi:hypothetical protein